MPTDASQSPRADSARANTIAWLATSEGAALLAKADALPDDRLTRLSTLRKQASAAAATAAVELLELRRRARGKFSTADRMFFTPEGLEQATGDPIAEYRASKFPAGAPVLDACCGIGGDALHLVRRGPVIAVDRNAAAAQCTRLNLARCYGTDAAPYPAYACCADVTALPLARLAAGGVRCAFFDPSRRGTDGDGIRRRLRSSEDYQPPLRWHEALQAAFPMVGVKVSPAIDDEALRRTDARVEFISDRGECKEAMVWLGSAADALALPPGAAVPYFATVLQPGRPPAILSPFACDELATGDVDAFLYEPDPAVIRAHLTPQLAAQLGAVRIDASASYLTAGAGVATPFAAAFRIVDVLPFRIKDVQRRLKSLHAHVGAVKKRGVPYEPASVQRALSPCGDLELVLTLMRRGERVIALLCERLPRSPSEP